MVRPAGMNGGVKRLVGTHPISYDPVPLAETAPEAQLMGNCASGLGKAASSIDPKGTHGDIPRARLAARV